MTPSATWLRCIDEFVARTASSTSSYRTPAGEITDQDPVDNASYPTEDRGKRHSFRPLGQGYATSALPHEPGQASDSPEGQSYAAALTSKYAEAVPQRRDPRDHGGLSSVREEREPFMK